MVFDADALFALARQTGRLHEPAGPRVLTPHAGEFARFLGKPPQGRDEMEQAAIKMARQWGVCIVLKGHRTLITDGRSAFHNATGNPGMATGGAGDVLTGLITALICQGLSPLEASRAGAHIHGLAGDLASKSLGQVALIASDLVRFLPDAFRHVYPR